MITILSACFKLVAKFKEVWTCFFVKKVILGFQNEHEKVKITLRVVQFWFEIKLVIDFRPNCTQLSAITIC